MKKRGISLLVLIITIIIIIIIVGSVILTLSNNGILDQSKKARFMNDFTNVQEGVNLYSFSKYNATTGEFELPLKGYLTVEDKTYIKENVPTLNSKIEELSGSLVAANLAWIDNENIGIKLSSAKREKGYIIDVTTWQIYDYNGDYFENKMWHTLDGGLESNGTTNPEKPVIIEELWDGWINLTLYYPAGSTEKKWRLGTEGELRVDPMLMWQNYTGSITIPLDRVKDVWIKYILDNKEIIIPPAGTLLVDIVPDKTGYTKVPGVNVNINYDETATIKEYRVGDSGWITYNGQFIVTENCIIEARAKKTETIYNTDGSVLATRGVAGRDLVYIGNIGMEETQLEAPIITRLSAIGDEKARVQVVYPENAYRKIYKINYGVEENYTSEISVTNYGTYIIAYYYDNAGKRSKAAAIRINDTTGGLVSELPVIYEPKPPYEPGNPPPVTPTIDIPSPIVNVNPTALAEEVQVSINSPANADKVYIKLGRYANYELYTLPITVRQNMEVYAYYKTYMGERSNTGYGVVNNIKKNNKPYVYINANPYPWSWSYGKTEVMVTINYTDVNIIEYSEDGIIYKPYTGPFKVTENKRIYARGTNAYGVTETSLNITNIGKLAAPKPVQTLAVNINANPEPILSTTRSEKVIVTIDYDIKATEKYYSIGRYGELKTYTGQFDVTSSCTVYAYAKGINAKGQASKRIDNVSNGIADPTIIADPSSSVQASKVNINIEYDKYAIIKRYSIDGSSLKDYTGQLVVTKNGSVIYAYSQNELGQKSESSYTIENIVPEPPILTLDKGNYYLLKLNYPEKSKGREYKWKIDGEWKEYKSAGILLIKPQFKDSVIQNGTLVKIEDENGNLITFTGDYYLINVPINELFENLFMRWDREPLNAPQIIINPTEPAMQVIATITYNTAIVKKQYKVIKPGETLGIWMDYTGPFTIDRNGAVVYAKGMDDTEVWSAEGIKKVTNIDENQPVIKLTADLDTAQQKVAIRYSVTDDVAVGKIKWAEGVRGESYFTNSGTEVSNNGVVNITSNGYYTFYAEDKVGNKQVYTLNVTNVDLTAPTINISVSPENTVGLTTDVTIDYGDSTIKQYKLGASNVNWNTYTNTFAISSYTILANNWQNADGTVTIFAKGKDTAGNEITVQKKVVSLDLDKPTVPIVNSKSDYATLYEYGAKFDATTTITYDTRTDIDNYYSVDNGTTWLLYTGQFDMSNGTVIAKSVKKSSGLEVVISKTIAMPVDALKPQAYDENDITFVSNVTNQYMLVDSSMQNKSIRIKMGSSSGATNIISFLNESKGVISTISNTTADIIYTIPLNTVWIKYTYTKSYSYSYGILYEIQPSNEPTINAVDGYMSLTADPTKAIKQPYQMVTISYFPTSIQRLYKIGITGDWLSYQDQPINVTQGLTIYAKGIDIYGNETRIVSSYTANVPDALKSQAYDGNDNTSVQDVQNQYMIVDSSMQNKSIRIKMGSSSGATNIISFLNESKGVISTISNTTADNIYTIPLNTVWIKYTYTKSYSYSYGILYEIQPSNEPTFNAVNGYMLLTADPTKAIKQPYQMVTVTYFPTSVQRLYRIGTTGDWINYIDQPVWINQGQTIYTKGIDIYGNETRIVSSYTVNVVDALKLQAYDGNDSTFVQDVQNQYMLVDSSMQNKSIRIKMGSSSGATNIISFLNESKGVISTISNTTADNIYTIPLNTVWIKYTYTKSYSYSYGILYEIQPSNEPTFNAVNGYMLLTAEPTKAIKQPYQMVTVTYFPTSVQRLYRIGTTGDWINYIDQPVWVNQGQTIYTKGIDIYGNETRIVSSYTVNVVDALKLQAYDGNDSTFVQDVQNQYMLVDSSMQNKSIRIKMSSNAGATNVISFLDENKSVISTISNTIIDSVYTIPLNTVWIKYTYTKSYSYSYGILYEIQPSNEPTFNAVNGYMLLTADPTKAIKQPYQMVTVTYFSTSVQRLYRIGTTGDWISYIDQPVWVDQDQTIYAKGIDIYGNETRIVSNYTINVVDALKKEAYDTNYITSVQNVLDQYMLVDSSMQNKSIRIKMGSNAGATNIISFLDENKNVISTISNTIIDSVYTIPLNTVWIKYTYRKSYSYSYGILYEIQPSI